MNESNPTDRTARGQVERALDAARRPMERGAAIMLAVAQRDLALARASSPAEIADEPGVDDPDVAYAAWIALLVDGERRLRECAVAAVQGCRRDDDATDPVREPVDVEFAAEFVDSVARARAAVAAMAESAPDVARAARHDVLVRWPADDRTAAAALADRFPDLDGEA